MANGEPLIGEVTRMLNGGMQTDDIIATLQSRGYPNEAIQSALTLATTKASMEDQPRPKDSRSMIEPPAPGMQPSVLSAPGMQSIIIPPVPAQTTYQYQPLNTQMMSASSRDAEEKIEEIAEAIIQEKWQRVTEEVGDLRSWKERVNTDMMGVKQEILRVQGRLEAVQNTVLGRVKEYDKSIEDVGADVKAIEMLLKNILEPLTTNVKDLKAIAERLKK